MLIIGFRKQKQEVPITHSGASLYYNSDNMKKKAAIIVLTAFLIVSFHQAIYAQAPYVFQKNRNVVMATNGLTIRSEKVQFVHKDHYGLDTVYTIKSQLRDHPVYGYWQKVKFKDYEGYVLNAFLKRSYTMNTTTVLPKGTNKDFIFLKPGYDCSDEFFNSNEYIWYGYYQEETEEGKPIKKPM